MYMAVATSYANALYKGRSQQGPEERLRWRLRVIKCITEKNIYIYIKYVTVKYITFEVQFLQVIVLALPLTLS